MRDISVFYEDGPLRGETKIHPDHVTWGGEIRIPMMEYLGPDDIYKPSRSVRWAEGIYHLHHEGDRYYRAQWRGFKIRDIACARKHYDDGNIISTLVVEDVEVIIRKKG